MSCPGRAAGVIGDQAFRPHSQRLLCDARSAHPNGSYQQSRSKSDGSHGTANYDAATGETSENL